MTTQCERDRIGPRGRNWRLRDGGAAGPLAVAATLALAAPAAATPPGQTTPPASDAAVSASIQMLYVKHCTACHGPDGHGDGPAAEFLYPKPRAFRDSPIRFGEIEATIRDGLPRSAMPGFTNVLADEQITGLAKYVAQLRSTSIPSGVLAKSASTGHVNIPDQPYLPGLVARGAALYRSMSCVGCHGALGRGDGVESMQDSLGKPVRPADLGSGLYKSGQRPEDLYRAIYEGVPGTPMPAFGSLLVSAGGAGTDDVWALVAFVRSLATPQFHGHASGLELPVTPVDDAMLADASHVGWIRTPSSLLSVRPLWFRVEDTVAVSVSVVRSGNRIGVHLSWDDPTCDVNQDSGTFPDGIAIMFARSDDVPPLPMGVQIADLPPTAPVDIWHWKASRQFDASSGRRHDADEPRALSGEAGGRYQRFGQCPHMTTLATAGGAGAEARVDQDLRLMDPLYRTAAAAGNIHSNPLLVPHGALEASAVGFGTLRYQAAESQNLRSTAVWADGHWFVTIYQSDPASATASSEDDARFAPGSRIPITLAVWNGSKGDRNGTKLISGWHWLVVDGPGTRPASR